MTGDREHASGLRVLPWLRWDDGVLGVPWPLIYWISNRYLNATDVQETRSCI